MLFCVLSFVDSTDEKFSCVVNVFDVAELTKQRNPRIDHAVVDSALEDEESYQGSSACAL